MIENIESIVSILPTGVVVVNREGKIEYMNPYARDNIVGQDAFGMDVFQFHPDDDRERVERFFFSLSDNRVVDLPLVKIINFNNRDSMYLVRLTRVYDESDCFSGVVAIFYDLSSFTLSEVKDRDNAVHVVVKKLPVVKDEKVVFLDTDEVVFIRSLGSSSLLFDQDGVRYYSNLRISELEKALESSGFFRSHKSYIVNLAFLKEMHCSKGTCRLLLKAKKNFYVPISRRSRPKLTELVSIK